MSEHEFVRRKMTGAVFDDVDLTGARLRNVLLRDVVMSDVGLVDVTIGGEIRNVRVNGVDIGPLVEAELDRRYPERPKMRPTDADGFREAWAILERLWHGTVARARALHPDLLHERVGGEFSFVETLRHLLFATDAWVRRVLLGEPAPWDPLDLTDTDMADWPHLTGDRDLRPSLDEVLALRADRQATVRRLLADLTDERLAERTEPTPGPGYPEPDTYPVRNVLAGVLHEEWEHRLYAERDLDTVTARDG